MDQMLQNYLAASELKPAWKKGIVFPKDKE